MAMGFIEWLRLGLQLRRAQRDLERKVAMGFDWRKNLWKGFWSFIITSAGIVVPVLLNYWADPAEVAKLLDQFGLVAWAPLFTAMVRMVLNYWKNSGK